MTRFRKTLARALLALPWIISLPFLLVIGVGLAIVLVVEKAHAWLELWATYDGDKDAQKKDRWRDR